MNNKIIKSRKDLPEWFLNKEYKELTDPISWAVEIRMRINLRLYITFPDKNIEGEPKPSSLLLRMLAKLGDDYSKCYSENGKVVAIPAVLGSYEIKQPVSHMTIRDALHVAAILPEETHDTIQSITNLVRAKKKDYEERPDSIESYDFCKQRDSVLDEISRISCIDNPVDDYIESIWNPYVSLASFISGDLCSVDLSLDDETLKNSFMEWVRVTRNERGYKILDRRSALTKETFIEWNKFKPLQVFDIDLWSKLTGIKITDPVLANFLWPSGNFNSEDINPVSRLRQVTRQSKVPDIISQDMLWRLKGLIFSLIEKK